MLKNSLNLFALFTMILFASCEKDLTEPYDGNYYFVTEATYIHGAERQDTVIQYQGSIRKMDNSTLLINYAPPMGDDPYEMKVFGSIEAKVDEDGNLSPAYSNEPGSGFSFSGRFEGTEKVSLTIDFYVASQGVQNINIVEGNRVVK
jgi:hypothetical protein